jgi:TonB-dependent starch-binding outer membrane protein SusC
MKRKKIELVIKNQFLKAIILILCFLSFNLLEAKNLNGIKIAGVVTDEAGVPLIGASILEKGSDNGVVTDKDGHFLMELTNQKNKLIVSYISYNTLEVAYTGESNLHIQLAESSRTMDEVVVVGYQTMRKSNITGSVASVKSSELNLSTPTIGQSLVGKVSGVQISQVSGAPYKSTKIRVRGTSSVNASSDPLYVIDGYPSNNDVFINPDDVESIEVLKDAASAAIYGSRASGGVVMITTKRGKEGKTQVTYDYQFGINQLSRKVQVLNAAQFTDLFVSAHNNT